MIEKVGRVEKGWGYELIWVSNELYCSKLLHFNKGGSCSMHFHAKKMETWHVLSGEFRVDWLDTNTGRICTALISEDSIWENPPLSPHRLTCLEEGHILEVSTASDVKDNYRVMPGDSQHVK